MNTAENSLTLIYRIDPRNRITGVNPAWSEFARDNHGLSVMPENILGSDLMAAVADETAQELYLRMISRARAGILVRFRYRCDAPDKRRTFEMVIKSVPGGEVEFVSTLLHEEIRPSVALLEPGQPRNQDTLRVCSWCQKVAMTNGRWLPVEEAVETLRLLNSDTFPRLTHGICDPCCTVMMEKIRTKRGRQG